MSPPSTAAARRTRRRDAQGHVRVPAPGAPRIAPRAPRRVSGPATAPARGQPLREHAPGSTRGARLLAWLRALPDHRLTDRLVRGRAWIVVVGFLLIGIVAMQVSLLRLNSSIGRAVAQSANLERHNSELRVAVSRMSSEQRVQAMGAKLGLVAPDAGRVTYLTARGSQDARDAAQALSANQARARSAGSSSAQSGAAPAAGAPTGGDRAAGPSSDAPGADAAGLAPDGTATEPSPLGAVPAPSDSASAAAGAIAAPGR